MQISRFWGRILRLSLAALSILSYLPMQGIARASCSSFAPLTQALAAEPAGGRYPLILSVSARPRTLRAEAAAGRDARAIHGFHFKGAPLSILWDAATGFHLTTFEHLLQSVTQLLRRHTGIETHAILTGSSRTLRSGLRPNINVDLEIPNNVPRRKGQQLRRQYIDFLRGQLRLYFKLRTTRLKNVTPPGTFTITPLSTHIPVMVKAINREYLVSAIVDFVDFLLRPPFDDTLRLEQLKEVVLSAEYWIGRNDEYIDMRHSVDDEPTQMQRLSKRRDELWKTLESDPTEAAHRIRHRIEENVVPFVPARDIHSDRTIDAEILDECLRLIHACPTFSGSAAIIPLLQEMAQKGRIVYADNLPGILRAQKFAPQNGGIGMYILVDSSLAWLLDSLNSADRSAADRQAIISFLSGKLIHEGSEILMEPRVTWELGDQDPAIAETEAVAYFSEVEFLRTQDGFLEHFEHVLHDDPPLLNFYRIALHGEAAMPLPHDINFEHYFVSDFLRELGYSTHRYHSRNARDLWVSVRQLAYPGLDKIDAMARRNFQQRLIVIDAKTHQPKVLNFIDPATWHADRCLQAAEDLERWQGVQFPVEVGHVVEMLRHPSAKLSQVRLAISPQSGEIEAVQGIEGRTLRFMEIRPENVRQEDERPEHYQGVGQELFIATLKELMLDPSPKPITISVPYDAAYAYVRDNLVRGLGRELPCRRGFVLSRSDVVYLIRLHVAAVRSFGIESAGRNADGPTNDQRDFASPDARFLHLLDQRKSFLASFFPATETPDDPATLADRFTRFIDALESLPDRFGLLQDLQAAYHRQGYEGDYYDVPHRRLGPMYLENWAFSGDFPTYDAVSWAAADILHADLIYYLSLLAIDTLARSPTITPRTLDGVDALLRQLTAEQENPPIRTTASLVRLGTSGLNARERDYVQAHRDYQRAFPNLSFSIQVAHDIARHLRFLNKENPEIFYSNAIDYTVGIEHLIPLLDAFDRLPDEPDAFHENDPVVTALIDLLSADPDVLLHEDRLRQLSLENAKALFKGPLQHAALESIVYPFDDEQRANRYFDLLDKHLEKLVRYVRFTRAAQESSPNRYHPAGRSDLFIGSLLEALEAGKLITRAKVFIKEGLDYFDRIRSSLDRPGQDALLTQLIKNGRYEQERIVPSLSHLETAALRRAA